MSLRPIRTAVQVGVALRERRKALGLTQSQLSQQLNVRQATVSDLESGKVDVKLSTLLDALGALDLELALRPRSRGPERTLDELF